MPTNTSTPSDTADRLTVVTARSWFFECTEAGWHLTPGETEAKQEIESIEDRARFNEDCARRDEIESEIEGVSMVNQPSLYSEWELAEKEIEEIKESRLNPLQKELMEIEFMSPEELDLRVQPADARKLTARALRHFFIELVQRIDPNDESVAPLKQMIDSLTEVIDRAVQA